MSINSSNNGSTAAAATDSEPLAPEIIAQTIRGLHAHVPDFVHLPIPDARALRSVASVSAAFVQEAINAVAAAEKVQALFDTNAVALRQQTEEAARWTEVEAALRTMLEGVSAANLVRRHRIGLTALQTYQVIRQLARKPEHSNLLPSLAEMRRLIRSGRKRSPASPAPPPVTPPTAL